MAIARWSIVWVCKMLIKSNQMYLLSIITFFFTFNLLHWLFIQSVELINPCRCLPLEHRITTACTLCPCTNPPFSASNVRRGQSNVGLRTVFAASKHVWTVHVGNAFMMPALTQMNYAILSLNILLEKNWNWKNWVSWWYFQAERLPCIWKQYGDITGMGGYSS